MIAAAALAPQMLEEAQLLQLQMEQAVDYLAFLKTTGLNGVMKCISLRCDSRGLCVAFQRGRRSVLKNIAAGSANLPVLLSIWRSSFDRSVGGRALPREASTMRMRRLWPVRGPWAGLDRVGVRARVVGASIATARVRGRERFKENQALVALASGRSTTARGLDPPGRRMDRARAATSDAIELRSVPDTPAYR